MKKLESTLSNMVIVLTCVTLVAAALLGVMHEVTAEPIAAIEKQKLDNGIKKVILGSADAPDQINVTEETLQTDDGDFTVYRTTDAQGAAIGTAVKTAVQGFSPNLTVLVGFDPEGNILGYDILKHEETPGLGANVGHWFQKGAKGDIIGMNPSRDNITVSKDGGDVDAITASTITSRAFLGAVNKEYNAIFQQKANGSTGATSTAAPSAPANSAPAGDAETSQAD